MSPALTTAALVAFIATSAAFIGPALDDIEADQAVHAELHAATAAEQRRARMEAAAQAMCEAEGGPEAVATWLADGSVQCRTRRGYKTQHISVAQVAAQGVRP